MKTIPVEPEGNIYVPLPSRRHHVARVTYKILLAVLTAVALGAAVKSSDPMITPSLVLFTPSLPAFWYVEYKIRQVRSWKQDTRKYRGILFTAEFCIPLALSMAVTSVPSLRCTACTRPRT
jgi:hypothetical protein